MSGIAKTAPMFTAEAAKDTNLAEFQALALDQFTQGEYLTETHTEKELLSEEEKDSTGKVTKKAEYAEYRVTSLKLDSTGRRVVMNESALHEFEIKVTQFQIRGVRLDSVSQNQLDVVKKRETQRVANITEAETAKQLAITNEANGKANAAKAKWDAISHIQVPIVPEYNIEGGSKGTSGIDALASAKAFEVINGMKAK